MTNPVIHALTQNDPSDRPPAPNGYRWSAIDRATSGTYPNGKITYYFDEPPPYTLPPQVPPPDWQKFRLAMVKDATYGAIAKAHSGNAARVENAISFDAPTMEIVVLLWNLMISEIPALASYRPRTADVTRWQAIANSANVPITYNADGTMK